VVERERRFSREVVFRRGDVKKGSVEERGNMHLSRGVQSLCLLQQGFAKPA
jgi:hypothetical protein